VQYNYDLAGKLHTVTGTYHVRNAFRYCGYVYDEETGFYFCNTRYYNPQWRRWLNADAMFIAGDALNASNMYAYCNGNPVMFVDPSGMASQLGAVFAIASIIIQTFFSFGIGDTIHAISVLYTAKGSAEDSEDFYDFVVAFSQGIASLISSGGASSAFDTTYLMTNKAVCTAMAKYYVPHFNMTQAELQEEIYFHAVVHYFPETVKNVLPDALSVAAREVNLSKNGDSTLRKAVYYLIWNLYPVSWV